MIVTALYTWCTTHFLSSSDADSSLKKSTLSLFSTKKGVKLQLSYKENIYQTICLTFCDTFISSYSRIEYEHHLLQYSCPSFFDIMLVHFETKETTDEDTSSILDETPQPINTSALTANNKHIQPLISRQLLYSTVSACRISP